MSADWQTVRIGDLGKVVTGKTPSTAVSENFGGNYPFITIPDLDGRREITASARTLSELGAQAMRSCRLPAGAVMMSCIATIGKCGITTRASFTNQQINSLICKDGVDPKFVYYSFSQLGKALEAAGGGGSVYTNVSKSRFESIEIKIPSLQTQKAIVAILVKLDDKIESNRRINQTLEAMAQALFKSWFVDFEPVKAKITAIQEGRDPLRAAMSAISGKADAELHALPPEQYAQLAATAALFPDEMQESEVGEIPKGWAFRSLADIAQFASGKTDVSSLTEDLYISTENMLENRAGITRASSLPSVATVPSFKAGQILVSNIRPYFKKLWMARFDGGRSPDVLAFEPTDYQWAEFAYNLMYQDAFFEFMTRTAKGAKMPRGDKDAIMGWRFPCPVEFLMIAFSENVRPNYAHIESLNSQNKSLSELRDALLPKLLSGELSVEALSEPTGAA
ncbi:MAG: restriction endonuclease subunit S [Burkholderiales bacterium]|jgi:type I restriction enzyme S subunit|nr:restriction endonuclease subunit S [Burkholderiales bacterium]MCA3154101.1 restriction endonuclease subunit S [Burkholderiales bacterium]MCA3156690.1 restriction endonuclease subunit S [Burkholderiales bacterium]